MEEIMNAATIVGYAYESDFHCIDCALMRFTAEQLADPYTEDREGNPVHAVFVDENDGDEICGDCGEYLMGAW
jgi:hypothetical protein